MTKQNDFLNEMDKGSPYFFPMKRFTQYELEELNQLANVFKNLKDVFDLDTNLAVYFAQHYTENFKRIKESEQSNGYTTGYTTSGIDNTGRRGE